MGMIYFGFSNMGNTTWITSIFDGKLKVTSESFQLQYSLLEEKLHVYNIEGYII